MPAPWHYPLRSLFRRRASTLLTLTGLALVVTVFAALSALNEGLKAAYDASGEPDNLIVLRPGATAEGMSGVSRERYQIIRDFPGIAKDPAGKPLIAAESVTIFNLQKFGGGSTNVLVRGIGAASPVLRRGFKLVDGRMPLPGLNELLAGDKIARTVQGLSTGMTLRAFNRDWAVVGRFTCGNTAFSSEVWIDAETLMPAAEQPGFNSVLLRAESRERGKALAQQIDADPRLKLSGQNERVYYKNQTEGPGIPPIFKYAKYLSVVLGFGAVFGAANLLYAAIAYRRREIATLRVLGFSRATVLVLFLVEGILLALVAGALGLLLAVPFSAVSMATNNWASFSAISFNFKISPSVITGSLYLSLFIGGVGSLFPALNAARAPVLDGLRKA